MKEREEGERGDWITEDDREEERSLEISKTGPWRREVTNPINIQNTRIRDKNKV